MEQNNNAANTPATDPLPVDPSNTANIGQHVEEGVVKIKESINKQSSEWEDKDGRDNDMNSDEKIKENYLKNPSPEEKE